MSFTLPHQVFRLIQKMNKSERRYFKIFASRHVIGENNIYETVFEYLCKQDAYDKFHFEKHFKGQALLNNAIMTFKRLYEHLLKSLESYHTARSKDLEIRHLLNCAEILYQKSLYDACSKHCEKIVKLAIEHDKPSAILEAKIIQKKLIEVQNYTTISHEELIQLTSLEREQLSAIENRNMLWSIKSRILQKLNTEGAANSSEDLSFYKTLSQQLDAFEKPHFEDSYLYLQAKAAAAFALKDYPACLAFVLENLSQMEQSETSIRSHLNRYLSLLSNGIYLLQVQQYFAEAKDMLNKLKILSRNQEDQLNEDLKYKIRNTIYSTELVLNNLTGEFNANMTRISEIQKEMPLENSSDLRYLFFHYHFAVSALAVQKFSICKKYLNILLGSAHIKNNIDIYLSSRMLEVLLLIELNDRQGVKYALNNCKRLFIKNGRMDYGVQAIFSVLGKFSQAQNQWDQEEIVMDFFDNKKNLGLAQHASVLGSFPYLCWLETKIKNTDLATCVRNQSMVLSK